jgi:AraC family transcriptional regulator
VAQEGRLEYERRMHRVLEHIDRHLDERLDLDTLASVASFSSFHFHRLFSAWMGETLGDYLRRRRLETAAVRLASQPELAVLNVALSVGFGSTEAFTRAFKARFGCPPSAWRSASRQKGAESNPNQANRKWNQASRSGARHHGVRSHEWRASMNVSIVDRQPTSVAYLRHIGPYGSALSEFWQNTVYPWMVANKLLDRPRYGVSHDDPSVTAPEKCRYDACVDVPADFVGAGTHLKTVLLGGKYAVAPFKGTVDDIAGAWNALLHEWLPESNMQLDARPFLEHYPFGSSYDPTTGMFDCQLCVPVAPL